MTSDSKAFNIVVPPATVEEQTRADALVKLWETRKLAPLTLGFPVLILQLPYILMSPTRREWVPKGMFIDVWRALSWPFAGIFFWWFLGRSVEALFAARQSIEPRINCAETSFAGILCIIGVVTLVGILTSTLDDRRDLQFMAWVAGGLLWGILATALSWHAFCDDGFKNRLSQRSPHWARLHDEHEMKGRPGQLQPD